MVQEVLRARLREEHGKGAARRLRKQRLVQAVLYGGENEKASGISLTLDAKEITKLLKHEKLATSIVQLTLEGAKKDQNERLF